MSTAFGCLAIIKAVFMLDSIASGLFEIVNLQFPSVTRQALVFFTLQSYSIALNPLQTFFCASTMSCPDEYKNQKIQVNTTVNEWTFTAFMAWKGVNLSRSTKTRLREHMNSLDSLSKIQKMVHAFNQQLRFITYSPSSDIGYFARR